MAAPAALKPFVRALAELEPHVAQAFTPWLPRLSLLVGSLARASTAGGDPDGVDGVARRGPYERLLLSEWALALEHPDEFSRRAVMNEHLFVDLKRREPQGALHSLLLVDPGPDQLGSPRILHIAAALVAEARAKRAKAAFAWGALTDPVRVFPAVSPESVRAVLDARRATPLLASSLEKWHLAVSRFTQKDAAGGASSSAVAPVQVDVLFVGGAHLERLVASSKFAGDARVLRIDPLAGAVDASISTPAPVTSSSSASARGTARSRARPVINAGPRVRPLRLTLPDDATCVRALRDPFEVEVKSGPPPELEIDPAGGIVIPPGGRRILVRTKDGVAALAEPNSPRAPLGPAKRVLVPKGDVVVAAGMFGKRQLVITRHANGLRALFAGEAYALAGEIYPHLDGDPIEGQFVPPDDRVRLLLPMPSEVPFESATTPIPLPHLDGRGRAFVDGGRGYALIPYHRRVVELADNQLIPPFIHRGDKLSVWSVTSGSMAAEPFTGVVIRVDNNEPRHIKLDKPAVQILLGAVRVHGRVPGVIAIGRGTAEWILVHANDPLIIVDAPGVDVLGCTWHPAHGPCLVGREDARRLVLVGKDAIERHAFAVPVVDVAVNMELPQLAVLTKDGTVTTLFLKTGARTVVARSTAKPASAAVKSS